MAIANKFIHFNTEAGFKNYLFTGNGSGGGFLNQEGTDLDNEIYSVKPEKQEEWNKFKNYTCFIKDNQKIWTHEKFYGGTNKAYNLDTLIASNDTEVLKEQYDILLNIYNSKIPISGYSSLMSGILPLVLGKMSDDTIGISFLINQGDIDHPSICMPGGMNFLLKSDGTKTRNGYGAPRFSATIPKVNGTANAGTLYEMSRADHVHPAQTSVSGNAGTATKLETSRLISLSGDVSGNSYFDGSKNITINTNLSSIDASKITSGTIDIERLPKGALERLVVAENQTARFQLTSNDVQEGDTVKQEDTGVMYFVVDINNLDNENGYKVYTAGSATSVPWSGVTNKPSTISGYGITDAKINNGTITLGSQSITPISNLYVNDESGDNYKVTEQIVIVGDDNTITTGVQGNEIKISHNSEDGFLHVPATGTTNQGKVLTAGSTAGSMSWEELQTPTALPNPYSLIINGTTYNGSSEVTLDIGSDSVNYSTYSYSATSIGTSNSVGINANTIYYPNSSSTSTNSLTIYVNVNNFIKKNRTIVVVYGTRTVNISYSAMYGQVIKQNNILTTGTNTSSYRIYCFTYIGSLGTYLGSSVVAVNCAEYSA